MSKFVYKIIIFNAITGILVAGDIQAMEKKIVPPNLKIAIELFNSYIRNGGKLLIEEIPVFPRFLIRLRKAADNRGAFGSLFCCIDKHRDANFSLKALFFSRCRKEVIAKMVHIAAQKNGA